MLDNSKYFTVTSEIQWKTDALNPRLQSLTYSSFTILHYTYHCVSFCREQNWESQRFRSSIPLGFSMQWQFQSNPVNVISTWHMITEITYQTCWIIISKHVYSSVNNLGERILIFFLFIWVCEAYAIHTHIHKGPSTWVSTKSYQKKQNWNLFPRLVCSLNDVNLTHRFIVLVRLVSTVKQRLNF